MSDNKNTSRGWKDKGYYIALILCAAAIGITSYVYYQNTNTPEEVLIQEREIIPVGTMTTQEDVPVLATQGQSEQTQTESTASPTQPPVKRRLTVMAPVSGQEVYGYSMETLSYNETTRDWRVHNGVDFAAEEGTPVCAAADGRVCDAYEDDLLGTTVVIQHEGGYTTQYSSLGKTLAVAVGDQVTAGQSIGSVGSTALVETTQGSHLHFCVTFQEKPMDPEEFLSMGE